MDLAHRQVLEELRLLEDDADPLAKGAVAPRRIVPEHGHLARVALAVSLQDLDRGRFAGAVRAEQSEHLALGDLEADPAHRFLRAVGLVEIADEDRRSAHDGKSSTTAPAGGNAGSVPSPRAAAMRPQSGW